MSSTPEFREAMKHKMLRLEAVAQDSKFWSQSYNYDDPSAIVLKYPENAVVVVRKNDEFPRLRGEKHRCTSLADANKWILSAVRACTVTGTQCPRSNHHNTDNR